MNRKIFASDEGLCLAEFLPCDYEVDYQDWQDIETQRGYNTTMSMPYDKFQNRRLSHRLYATIVHEDVPETVLGIVMLSPPNTMADLAIRIFAPYREKGIGTKAFALATKYAVETLQIEELHAGCYAGNQRSANMLGRCGFVRFPEGDQQEEHYLTGETITQEDYVFCG